MTVQWNDLGFVPSPELAREIAEAWEWLICSTDWSPVICSRLGDLFFERPEGQIDWLNCSSGSVEFAANSRSEFEAICRDFIEPADIWFGPLLIERALSVGKKATGSDCYHFVVMQIFAECTFEPDNLAVVPVREVFVGLANVHRQLTALPDGQRVQIKVID